MSRTVKTILVIVGVMVVLAGYWAVDNFIYPIRPVHPNYSDVEDAFAKLQFPADWKEISSSENRGLHGRDCDPLENSNCFHKSKTFSVPTTVTEQDVVGAIKASGCSEVITRDITPKGDTKPSKSFTCSLGKGLSYGADLIGPEDKVYVSAKTY